MTIWCSIFFQHFYRFDSLQNPKWGPALLRPPQLCPVTNLPSLTHPVLDVYLHCLLGFDSAQEFIHHRAEPGAHLPRTPASC